MSKNKFYFSHDGGARNDDKLIAVRMRLKAEGYAVYFMILEKLLESTNYMSVKDYNVLAFDFRVGADVVKSVIEDFGLFEFSECGKYFFSEKFNDRMKPLDRLREQRSEAGRKSAEKRANSQKSNENSTTVERPLSENSTEDKRRDYNVLLEKEPKYIFGENEKNEPPDQNSVEELKSEKKEKEKSSAKKEKAFGKPEFRQALLDLGAASGHVDDWLKVRTGKRAVFTETALNAFTTECAKHNFPIPEAVRICAERSWQGFKYQWILNEGNNGTTQPQFAGSGPAKEPYLFDRERAIQTLTGQNQ